MNILTPKLCSECGELKEPSEFRQRKYKSGKIYLYSQCKKCEHKQFHTYLHKNPNKKKLYSDRYRATDSHKRWRQSDGGGKKADRKQNLRKFNLTFEQYDKMVEEQNGVCAICGGVNRDGRRLYIDHDHKNGKIRGLLCRHCNLILGLIEDDAERALSMSKYLRSHQDVPVT